MTFQPPKGMRDLSGKDAEKLMRILQTCRNTFEKYGFVPLETPALESFEVLAAKGAGEAIKDEIYYFKDKSGRELGLRFDFTVPLARFVANNPNMPKPFRRYQIGPVWRYDNPQAKRWRQFYQADIDIVGSSSPLADAECIACVCEIMQKLGFSDFTVRVNSRIVLESLLERAGVTKTTDAIRIIDKIDKIGEDGVKKELKENGIDPKKTMKIIGMRGKSSLKELEKEKPAGLPELLDFLRCCESFGISGRIEPDASLARGMEYYTSLVFEIMLPQQKVSFGAGGRFDNLIKTLGGPDLPATGISLGVDRLLEEMGETKDDEKAFIATIGNVQDFAIAFTQKLRGNGIKCELELSNRNISKQLDYASKKYRYVAIIGEREAKAKKAKLRDMETGEEKLLKAEDLIKALKRR
ncbi:MAG: histidine--tRNA ligase [Candidatus Aenigmarchaeota archaeon]|nr:histidine--tRNA ligase [Candidatus Aenigmarchaeota archaeon]